MSKDSNDLGADLKTLETEMKKAVEKMHENLRRAQDAADQALAESKKYSGVIEAKTADLLKQLDENRVKLQEEVLALRTQIVDIAQKMATRPQGSDPADEQKTISEIILESEQWKSAASRGIQARAMEPVLVKSFHRKTAIVNASGTGQPLVPAQRTPGIVFPAEQRLFIRDLLPQAEMTSNAVEFPVEATFTNAAAPQYDASPGSTEGAKKAESGMTFTLTNVAAVTIAHWIPASRQVLSDSALLRGHVEGRLVYGLKLEEEKEILTGDGTSGKINGLTNQAAAYDRGVTNDSILDTLLKAILQVSLSNYEASAFVLHPIDWFNAMLLKDTQGRYLFTNPQDMAAPRVWSKPVVASQSMTQGKFLCGAFNLGAQIWDREDATVRISENVDDHFIRNMVAILAEERLALAVYRSTAFVYGDTSHAG